MIKDFEKFFVKQQLQYNEMVKILEKVNKELTEGKCTQEQRDNFETYFSTVKNNYDRLSYARFLIYQPPKFIQKLKKINISKKLKEFKRDKADEDSVLKENRKALKEINKSLKELENEGGLK